MLLLCPVFIGQDWNLQFPSNTADVAMSIDTGMGSCHLLVKHCTYLSPAKRIILIYNSDLITTRYSAVVMCYTKQYNINVL